MLVEPHTFLLLAMLVVVAAASPGPDVFYLSTNALSGKWRNGLAAFGGIFTGCLLYACLTALGLAAVFAVVPWLYDVVKWAGVAYLAYLGCLFLRAALRSGRDVEFTASPEKSVGEIYRKGVLVNLLNPKTVLFFTSFLPQFVVPAHGQISLQFLLLGIFSVLIGHLVYAVYLSVFVTIGRQAQRRALHQNGTMVRILNGCGGLLYLCFSCGLAMWRRA